MVTFYTTSDRIQAWIKTLDIYYYDNLGKDHDLKIEWRDDPIEWKDPNEWHDDPIEWKDPNNSANSIVIEILTRGSQEPVIAHLDQSCFQ